MTERNFRAKISTRFKDVPVEFHHCAGKHLAVIADAGITICGNVRNNHITVNWGAGYCATGNL